METRSYLSRKNPTRTEKKEEFDRELEEKREKKEKRMKEKVEKQREDSQQENNDVISDMEVVNLEEEAIINQLTTNGNSERTTDIESTQNGGEETDNDQGTAHQNLGHLEKSDIAMLLSNLEKMMEKESKKIDELKNSMEEKLGNLENKMEKNSKEMRENTKKIIRTIEGKSETWEEEKKRWFEEGKQIKGKTKEQKQRRRKLNDQVTSRLIREIRNFHDEIADSLKMNKMVEDYLEYPSWYEETWKEIGKEKKILMIETLRSTVKTLRGTEDKEEGDVIINGMKKMLDEEFEKVQRQKEGKSKKVERQTESKKKHTAKTQKETTKKRSHHHIRKRKMTITEVQMLKWRQIIRRHAMETEDKAKNFNPGEEENSQEKEDNTAYEQNKISFSKEREWRKCPKGRKRQELKSDRLRAMKHNFRKRLKRQTKTTRRWTKLTKNEVRPPEREKLYQDLQLSTRSPPSYI